MYLARKRYEPTAKLSSWIYKIATNLCLKELRRKRRMPVEEKSTGSDNSKSAPSLEIPDFKPSVLDELQSAERERLVASSIAGLPKHEKTALLLRKYHALSYKEIADAMGCSEGAVKTYIHRGKLRLKERLLPFLSRSVS
jgi:RNA polymerase sigma-70 factor (ECF subfamily)